MISPKKILSTIYHKYLPEKIRNIINPVKNRLYPYIQRFYHILKDLFPPISLLNDKNALALFIAGRRRDAAFLLDRMFQAKPEESVQDRKFIFNISSIDCSSANMVVIEADRCFSRFFIRRGFFAIPEWVLFTMDISAPFEKITCLNHRRRYAFREIDKYHYTYEAVSDNDKLYHFYHTMYLPYVSSRHKHLFVHTPLREMEDILKNGKLLLVKRDNELVSGMLIMQNSSIPLAKFLGVKDGSIELVKEGASTAAYYYTILWAKENGYTELDFGHCRPVLNDGVFRFKKKLGMKAQKSTREYRMLYLSIRDFNQYLVQFLSNNPLIHEDRGHMKGLLCMQNSEPLSEQEIKSLKSKYSTPGLEGFTIIFPDSTATQI